jgi:catalase-peroxidase
LPTKQNKLNLQVLHRRSERSNPMAPDFDYGAEFRSLDVEVHKRDILRASAATNVCGPASSGRCGKWATWASRSLGSEGP